MRRLVEGIIAVATAITIAGCGGGGTTTGTDGAVTSGGGDAGSSSMRVYLPSAAFERRYVEPSSYELAVDGSLVGLHLSWRGWGSATATARGRVMERDWSSGDPGHLPTYSAVVVARGLEECRREALYTEILVEAPRDAVQVPEEPTKLPTPCHPRRDSQAEDTSKPLHFSMPSRNIACALSTESIRCDIARKSWSPPRRPDGCRVDWGNIVSLPANGGPTILCAGGSLFGAEYLELPYGEIIVSGELSCLSRKDGLTCINEEKSGFFLSFQNLTLF